MMPYAGETTNVIPFPRPPLASPEHDSERLARALAALDRAVEDERQAIAAWRESLATLDRTVSGVAGSMQHYQSALDELAQGVQALHETAVRTERAL